MRKLLPVIIILTILTCICLFLILFTIPSQATRTYGPPATGLTISQRVQYSAQLLWYDGLLTRPLNEAGTDQVFVIDTGESVNSVDRKSVV